VAALLKKEKLVLSIPKVMVLVWLPVKTRLKIYKKEGYDWANKSVRYYSGPA
jgi:hypothetical protein